MKLFSSGSKKWFITAGVALLLTVMQQAQAQRRPITYTQYLSGVEGSLAKDSSRTITDSVYLYPLQFPDVDTTSAISNMVVFYVDETSLRMPPDSFKVDLEVKIYFTNRAGVSDSTALKTLTIEYNKTRPYNSKALYIFKDAPRVQVKVSNIVASYAPIGNILPMLKMENRMAIGRIFSMDCEQDAITTVSTNTDFIATNGELQVSWPSLNAAQEYDLEWTFVDQTALDAGWYNVGGTLDPNLLFRNNATRVTILKSFYLIPLLYEGDGKLFYRVRAAQTTIDGERKVTDWSSDHAGTGGLGEYTFTGHEPALNWQASTSFAEEGKRKSVVQYFDGTLRNRQTVTKDNVTDTTIVAETFYDKQGRSVVQVLPAPSLTTLIKYNPLFNQGYIYNGSSYTTEEYHQGQYDSLKSAADYCEDHAPPLSTASGSSKYYSPQNQNKNELIHRYIPDAEMYPFTEVKYTQDNTGRIASQGGVGPVFQLNSGHETKYYYGTPSQQELDALFGTEAGYASHYQKNMVRDANGQYSVSYVDMHGRTVATALAGRPPASLDTLSSYDSVTRVDNLLDGNNNIIRAKSIESTKGLVVTTDGNHKFIYTLDPESLSIADKDNVDICYDCLYDLTITITDDCNNQLLPGAKPYVKQVNNMQVALPIYDTTCSAARKFKDTIDVYLKEGSYVITKKLTLREDAMNWYRDSLYAPHNTVKTKEQIIAEQLEIIRSQRGNDCVQEGEPWYEYQQYREQMLLDMTPPFGQYAKYPYPNTDPAWANVYSIFQSKTENGQTKYNFEEVSYPGNVNVRDMSAEQFANNFELEWAESLLVKHPEYRILQEYEKLKPSFHWDADFETTSTYAAAAAKGYLNPLNSATSPASGFSYGNDSLFYGGANSTLKSGLKSSMENYITQEGVTFNLWTFASIMGHCDPQDESCANLFRNTPSNVFSNTLMCEGERDMAWRFFRDQYLRLKRAAIADDVNSKAPRPAITAPATRVFTAESMAREASGAFLGNDAGAALQAGKDSMNAIAARSCENYVSYWWSQLSTCNYSAVDSLWLIPKLIQICKEGADSTHPFGASSIGPKSNNDYPYRSFDELITYYNSSIGKPTDGACNAFLIDNPVPYSKPIALVDQPWYSRPDDATCDRIASLRTQYNASSGYSSFSDFLQQKFNTIISDADLNRLDSLCNGTFGCKFTTKPITIPPALQPATGEGVCVDCNQVNTIYNAFKTTFPGSIPTYQEVDEQQQKTNQLFKNYMNSKLGFSKTALEYLQFLDTCGASFACDSLQALVKRYNKDVNPYRFRSFAQSNALTPVYHEDLNQITEDGALQWPQAIRDTTGRDWVYFQNQVISPAKFCFQNGYSIEWKFKSLKEVLLPVDDVFYYQDENAYFALSRAETGGTTGVFLKIIKGKSADNSSRVDLFVGNVLLDSDPDAIYKNWNKLKLTVTGTHIKIFYNDVLKKEVARTTAPLLNGGAFTLAFLDYQASVDWIKMYNASGSLAVFEDYNDPSTRAVVDPSFLCPQPVTNCQTPFVTYFNQQKGTSHTYGQIDSIYLKTCGRSLDICADKAFIYDSLQALQNRYNMDINPFRVRAICQSNSLTPTLYLTDISESVTDGTLHWPKAIRDTATGYFEYFQHAAGTQYCLKNGYAIEFKFKFLKNDIRDNEEFFYLTDANGGLVLYRRKEGPVENRGIFLAGITAIDSVTHQTINLSNENTLISTNPDLIFQEWTTIKYEVTPDSFRVYANGLLLKQVPRGVTVAQLRNWSTFTYSFMHFQGVVDWTKVYDATGKEVFFDDYLRNDTRQTIDPSFTCPPPATSCETSFTNYFNQQKGTSYTFSQIDSLYFARGMTLNVCRPAGSGYRDSLVQLVDSFYVNAKPGRVTHQYGTGAGNPVYTNLSELVHDGIVYLPDSVRAVASNWYNNYQWDFNRYCTQNGYTFEARFKFLENDLMGDVFYLGSRSLGATFFRGVSNGKVGFYMFNPILYQYDAGTPEVYPGYTLIDTNVNLILNWMVFKVHVKPDYVTLYYNGKLIWEHSRNPAIAIGNHANFGLGLRGRNGAIDWIRIGDVDDNTKYFEDFNDIVRTATVDPSFICAGATDCQLAFKNYYNLKRSTSYTYAQIDSIYRKAGITLDACGEMQSGAPSSLLLCGKNEPTNPTLRYEDIYDPPCSDSSILAYNSGTEIYNAYKDSLDQSFNSKYAAKCLGAASIESFTVQHPVSEYHYMLYYYDQAGNLVKTVAPAGVNPNRNATWLTQVAQKRKSGETQVPTHAMPTVYRYNSLNQVVSQKTPDAGKSTNWYDRLGRLAVSQNAQQLIDGKYSYTVYDHLGRITEVGQKPQPNVMTNAISQNPSSLFDWIYFNNGSNTYGAEMVTRTVYDEPSIDATPCIEELRFTQKPYTLRNRVSYTRYFEKPSYAYNSDWQKYFITGLSYTSGIDYSYDIHGNVDTMRNLYGANTYSPMTYHGNNACKTIAYHYDLISGKVNEVHYQPGQNDEFYHRYEYDAENRLTNVYTTDNKAFLYQQLLEEREAQYTYYKHGPLARTILGQQQVQGLDYSYNLQGWLKGINGNTKGTPQFDPGEDGKPGSLNQYIAEDVYGTTLRYFTGDYTAINSSAPNPFPAYEHKLEAGTYKPLYNGNISATTTSLGSYFTYLYNYRYDQLNRLVDMDTYRGFNATTNSWSGMDGVFYHREHYTYDANGNILRASRNG
ncbi:MAG: hypothetical protein ACTHLE_00895, partial [Agriterribacter sp.]